jgi:hypothetical protein
MTLFTRLVLTSTLFGVTLHAGIIYSHGSPDGFDYFTLGGFYESAVPFQLSSSATIVAADFWSQQLDPSGDVAYAFYSTVPGMNGSQPGGLLDSGVGPATETLWANFPVNIYELEFNLQSPLTLGPGAYFFGIYSFEIEESHIAGPAGSTPSYNMLNAGGPWVALTGPQGGPTGPPDFAFQLLNTPFSTPEPASAFLFAAGILTLLVFRGTTLRSR